MNEGDYRAIRALAKAKVQATTSAEPEGRPLASDYRSAQYLGLSFADDSTDSGSGEKVATASSAIYSDNYITLMPGERQTIQTELRDEDTRGEKPRVVLERLQH